MITAMLNRCMKRVLSTFILCSILSSAHAQTLTFSEDIASIIYSNCTSCHRSGGIAPFAMESYSDVVANSSLIPYYISNGIMPPWPPDTSYQRYSGERILTQQEIDDISDWISGGMPEGDTSLAPDPPVFVAGSEIGVPDLTVQIPTYTSNATNFDEYVCFSIPINISTIKYLKAIEVIPGNRAIVHHALVYLDTSGTIQTDTSGCLGIGGVSLMTGYTPGAGPTIFPSTENMSMGMTIYPNSNLVLQLHYPEGTAGLKDSTYVNLFFYPDSVTNVREVYAQAVLSNWSLVIPANTIDTFNAEYPEGVGTIPVNVSLLTVFPHMHLLGKSIETYAVSATNDTMPLARINNWDFEWQGFYNFKKLMVLTPGSKLYGEAVYDNTTANPNNPNDPPQLVIAGGSTTDEMFLVYFHWAIYEPGDELLNLDSLLSIPLGIKKPQKVDSFVQDLQFFPNPFSTSTTMEYELDLGDVATLFIMDVLGRTIRTIYLPQSKGLQTYTWNGDDMRGNQVKNGLYYFHLKVDGQTHSKKAVVIRVK